MENLLNLEAINFIVYACGIFSMWALNVYRTYQKNKSDKPALKKALEPLFPASGLIIEDKPKVEGQK
jgi:hypothetical protein